MIPNKMKTPEIMGCSIKHKIKNPKRIKNKGNDFFNNVFIYLLYNLIRSKEYWNCCSEPDWSSLAYQNSFDVASIYA